MSKFFSNYFILLIISFRNIFRNRNRSLLTVLAVAVGIVSTSFLTAIQIGSRKQIQDDAVRNMLGHLRVAKLQSFDETTALHRIDKPKEQDLQILSNITESKVSERIRANAVVLTERESRNIIFLGVVPKQEIGVSVLDPRFSIKEGRYLSGENDEGVIIGNSLSVRLKTSLGKRVVLLTQDSNGKSIERGFRVIGIFKTDLKSIEDSYVVTGLNTASSFLKFDNQISDLSFLINDTNKISEALDKLKDYFKNQNVTNQDITVKTWEEMEPFLLAIVKLQNGVLILWYSIVIVSVFFGVINTLLMTVVERQKEFSLYRALGLGSNLIIVNVFMEMFILLLFGSFIGILLSIFIIQILLSGGISLTMFNDGAELFGIRSIIFPYFSLPSAINFSIILITSCLVGIYFPTRNASKNRPTEGLVR